VLIDLLSAGFLGFFALLYVISFLCLELGARFFDLRSVQGQFLLVGLVVLVKEVVLVGLLDVFAFEVVLSVSLFLWFGASAFFTGLIAPIISSMLKRIALRSGAESREAP
jgi:cell shape-determining protein MreD